MKLRTAIQLLIPAIALCIAGEPAIAQSTNASAPTPISGDYIGKGPSSETNYYFRFTGGPGSVSVGLEIKPKDYSTFARIEIGNDPSDLIAMHNMNASTTTGPANVVKSFELAKQQSVRIKLTLDANLAEYKLTVSGGGVSSEDPGTTAKSGNAGASGKIGKASAGNGAKIGSLGSAGGKTKVSTDGSTETADNTKLSFRCPNDVMYKIVPSDDWNATWYSQKRFVFDSATVDGPKLFCTYTSEKGGGGDSATLTKSAPVGYMCSVFKGGSKSRDFTCTVGPTAMLLMPANEWQFVTR